MDKQVINDKKIIVTPASEINFKSEAIKKAVQKVKQRKKEWADLYKIDSNKLTIRISI